MIITGRRYQIVPVSGYWRLIEHTTTKYHGGIKEEITDIIEHDDPELIADMVLERVASRTPEFLEAINTRRKARKQRLLKVK